MGKFIDTKYFDGVDSLVNLNKDLVQNPFYQWNDKKCTKVTYYNINKEKSTLDPGSRLAYDEGGEDSPIRYNKIEGFYLYNFPKIELNLENDDFGMTGQAIQGESYIMPNTIIPTENDWFTVDHIKDNDWLFKVTDVQRDTLENGSNVYKISWQLDRTSTEDVVNNVVEDYTFVNTVEGTNVKFIVKSDKYEKAKVFEEMATNLSNYFTDLFWSDRVQTFIYKWYNEYNMYDPFAIEFIIRNRLLVGADNYFHVQHQCQIPKTFSIDYNKSVYRAIELRDKEKLLLSNYRSQADYIEDLVGVFKTRYEMYWKLNYEVLLEENGPFNPRGIIPIMEQDLIDAIENNDTENVFCFNKIIVKYFNKEEVTIEDLEGLDCIDLESAKVTYYTLLILIYILYFYTKSLLS